MKAIQMQTNVGEVIVISKDKFEARDVARTQLQKSNPATPVVIESAKVIADSMETNFVPLLILEK